MGNSLHNKIYLGHRTALLNVKRARSAALCSAFAGVVALLWLLAR